jgi:hypothetical protein
LGIPGGKLKRAVEPLGIFEFFRITSGAFFIRKPGKQEEIPRFAGPYSRPEFMASLL